MSCLIDNNIVQISDELINLICHNPEIQRLAVNRALNGWTKPRHLPNKYIPPAKVVVTPTLLTTLAGKLQRLQESDQVDSVKEYIRKLLGHGADHSHSSPSDKIEIGGKVLGVSPMIIDAIPCVLKLSVVTKREPHQLIDKDWPSELHNMGQLLYSLAEDLLDHVHPSPPDL